MNEARRHEYDVFDLRSTLAGVLTSDIPEAEFKAPGSHQEHWQTQTRRVGGTSHVSSPLSISSS